MDEVTVSAFDPMLTLPAADTVGGCTELVTVVADTPTTAVPTRLGDTRLNDPVKVDGVTWPSAVTVAVLAVDVIDTNDSVTEAVPPVDND
jgi:hypothetical protein